MLEQAWVAAGILPHCQIIWAKNRPVLTRTWYMWQHEPCLMGWKKGMKPPRVADEMLSTVWNLDTIANGEDRPDHPTPKPLECFEIPMQQHTKTGDLCYEPFCGSGTQIIAAQRLGRRCFGLEIEPRYIDVAVRRWQQMTGKNAMLQGTRKSWLKTAVERGVKLEEKPPDLEDKGPS
jgi:DNA modification methylase